MNIVNFGSMNIDHVYRVEHFVKGGETILASATTDSIGGKGLNQTLAVLRAGVKVYHAGLVGAGGEVLVDYLRENGADTSLIEKCSAPQGHAIIQNDPDGQNCIIVFGGSNQEVSRDYIDRVLARFAAGDYVLLQNEVSNIDYIVEAAAGKGLKVVLNASPINEALKKVDLSKLEWLVVNELECAAVAGCENTEDAYATLKQRYPDVGILLTVGEAGSVSCRKGEEIRQDAFKTAAVDTTAAGDTFMGYFIACLAQGSGRQEAMRYASMASSIAVSRPGAAPSIPYMDEVRSALR